MTSHSSATRRPALEVADIVRVCGQQFRATHRLSFQQHKTLRDIQYCRTAALGGHGAVCDQCGVLAVSYNSCGNRHCPKCQSMAKQRWVEKQCADLLPVPYFHVVFTLPHELNPVAQGNPELIYNLLFRAASQTLLAFGRNPRWLGGQIGITMVLHTWSQNLNQHIHVHCIVTGGALSNDHDRWIPASDSFLFPVRALSRVFRGKYVQFLSEAYDSFRFAGSVAGLSDPEAFDTFLNALRLKDWVVYAKKPFSSAEHVLNYLGRYTHRIAIANHRLIHFDGTHVQFRWRDYAQGSKNKTMTLGADEFLRRYLLHTLPRGFCRIRHYGLLGNRCRHRKLDQCRAILNQPLVDPYQSESTETMMLRLTDWDIHQCRHCEKGRLRVVSQIQPDESFALNPSVIRPP